MTTQAQERAQAVADQAEAALLSSNVSNGMQVGAQLQSDANSEISGEVVGIQHRNMVSIWNRETGTHSYALPYMVYDLAKTRVKSGRFAGQSQFVFRQSDLTEDIRGQEPVRDFPCYLSPEHPNAARYHAMGFAVCNSKPRPSVAALEGHMAHSHKRAWATIEKEVNDQRRDEDREFQREQTAALRALVEQIAGGRQVPQEEVTRAAQAASVPVADTPALDSELVEMADVGGDYSVECAHCEFVATGKSMAGAMASLRGHENREHPKN